MGKAREVVDRLLEQLEPYYRTTLKNRPDFGDAYAATRLHRRAGKSAVAVDEIAIDQTIDAKRLLQINLELGRVRHPQELLL